MQSAVFVISALLYSMQSVLKSRAESIFSTNGIGMQSLLQVQTVLLDLIESSLLVQSAPVVKIVFLMPNKTFRTKSTF